MSWVQSKSGVLKAGLAGALVFGLMATTPAAAQGKKQAIIVKSTSSEHKIGSRISESAEITLETGEAVTVLTSRGSRIMKGPGVFVVGANPKSNRARFYDLRRQKAAQNSAPAAVRGTPGAAEDRPLNPNLYYVDVDRSGPVCLRDLSATNLWRPFSAEAVTYTLSEAPAGENAQVLSLTVPFVKGENDIRVESERFALKDGQTYTISGPQAGNVTSITVIDLGADITVADELAEVLYQKGCMAQFELMVERLAPQ